MAGRVVLVLCFASFLPIIISDHPILGKKVYTGANYDALKKYFYPCGKIANFDMTDDTNPCTCDSEWYGNPYSRIGCQRRCFKGQFDPGAASPCMNDCGINANCSVLDCVHECMCKPNTTGNPYVMCNDLQNDMATSATIRLEDWQPVIYSGKVIKVLEDQSLHITIAQVCRRAVCDGQRVIRLEYNKTKIPFEADYKWYNGSSHTIIMIPKVTKDMSTQWICSFTDVPDAFLKDEKLPYDEDINKIYFEVVVKDAKRRHDDRNDNDRKDNEKDATSLASYLPWVATICLVVCFTITFGCGVCYFTKSCFFRSAADKETTIAHTRLKGDNIEQNTPKQLPESQAQSVSPTNDYVRSIRNEISLPRQTQNKPTLDTTTNCSEYHHYEEIDEYLKKKQEGDKNCKCYNQGSSTDDQDRSSPTYDYAYDHILLLKVGPHIPPQTTNTTKTNNRYNSNVSV